MKEQRELVCIVCPIGCRIKVGMSDGKIDEIMGNSCKRGADYAAMECINPVRTLTGTVRIINTQRNSTDATRPPAASLGVRCASGGNPAVVPVKSDKPLPRDMLVRCMNLVSNCSIQAPVKIGDVIVENILDTGVNIVATRDILQQG